LINPFQNIAYLAYPVLHELWMGIKDNRERKLLTAWRDRFIKLRRLILPTMSTMVLIGDICLALRKKGKLDPVQPKHYNDIAIAALAQQIGATVFTLNGKDFKLIQAVVDFEYLKL
jgi:predicted nucleic acid-binding protein